MDIFGVNLTGDNIINIENIISFAKWIFLVVIIKSVIYLTQLNNSRINKLYGYYEKHKVLKCDIELNQDLFHTNISMEMLESIEKSVTKVNDANSRNVFLYVLNNYNGKILNKFNLKGVFQIDFNNFHRKSRLYIAYFIISLLVFIISSFLFVYLFTNGTTLLKSMALLFLFISESATIILFDKIIRKSKMIKYNSALAEIDASAFKPV
ncbi:hypothetical protein [Moellerella wisconsensis]|uniref:hypothetical protein n=1 Tax=Moellerella wisconsensis TaxID=158849 RepID=UPI001F4DDE02|nr:hypothetical protein [Moellerella wisconsensis]UNH23153.1 hypothetical protein MNY68_09855 [Moellerella wisconsensis]